MDGNKKWWKIILGIILFIGGIVLVAICSGNLTKF